MRRVEHEGPADLAGMQELAERTSLHTGYMSIGDLAWNYALSYDRPASNPTAVWREDDKVAAWAWLQQPSELMMQVDPGYAGLAGEIIDWAEALATAPLLATVADSEHAAVAALTARGYRQQQGAPFFSCLSMPLAEIPAPPTLPDGYRIRRWACESDAPTEADIGRRVAVHRSAFDGSKVDVPRYRHMMGVHPYRRDLDVVVEAPDGSFAAYCLGWYDTPNRTGQFEPVGTHPEHRRRRLATAVNIAVLHGFRAAGGHRAIVNARGDPDYPVPKRLYESIGFRQHTRTRIYTKP